MKLPTINFIGCGRVGKTLASLIKEKCAGQIQDIYNAHFASSSAAVQMIGQGTARASLNEISAADLYFITVPDDQIAKVCQDLIRVHTPKKSAIFLHCSGSLTSEALVAAKEVGCYIASIHPIKSFADLESSLKTFAGTYCSFEGDEESYEVLSTLIKKIDGKLIQIEKAQKDLYHIASVFSSNYLVTLFSVAVECYQQSGLEPSIASDIAYQLMTGTLSNIKSSSPMQALTGPLERGDINTISRHLQSLQSLPKFAALYRELALNTLPLTRHDDELKAKFLQLFED